MKTVSLDDEATPEMIACSDDVRRAIDPLVTTHDGRLLFAVLCAEVAHLGALLKNTGIYQTGTILRVFAEAGITAVTLETKAKIIYTESGDDFGRKQ